jgi:hypothetical protein
MVVRVEESGGGNLLWWLGWRRVVVEICYGGDGGGESLLEVRKLVKKEGKLREKIIRNFVIFL